MMTPRTIQVHSENNAFQHVEVLKRSRVKRQQYGEFFVEGVTPLNRALEQGWELHTLVYSTGKRLSKWASGVLERSTAEAHLELSPTLMDQLSDKEEPSELLGVFGMPPDDLPRILVKEGLLVIAFDRPSNHGNLGTAIRSCDALGADGTIVTGHAVDLYDTRTIRASVGSLFGLPTVRLPSHQALAEWVASWRERVPDVQIVGTSAHAEREIGEVDLVRATILAVGNETIGLSRSYRQICDEMARIPMSGTATSLNMACATSILLYEAGRQRRGGT